MERVDAGRGPAGRMGKYLIPLLRASFEPYQKCA